VSPTTAPAVPYLFVAVKWRRFVRSQLSEVPECELGQVSSDIVERLRAGTYVEDRSFSIAGPSQRAKYSTPLRDPPPQDEKNRVSDITLMTSPA